MAPNDPAPCSTNDEILAQVRDELRGLRADLKADREARAKATSDKPKRAPTKRAPKGTQPVDGR